MQIQNPIFLTILFAATISAAASAGVIVPGNPSAGQHPLEIRKQQFSVTVRDQVARVTVDEQFENHTDLPLEGTYLMPLPEGAAVSGFATWIDGVRVESRIEEKSAAKASYDAAKKDGAAPALLEQDAHSFKMHVDGIPPRGTKRVEASYAQILPYDSGEVTLRLPIANAGEQASDIRALTVRIAVTDQKKIVSYKMLSSQKVQIVATGSGFELMFEEAQSAPQDLAISYRIESSRLGLSFVPFKPTGVNEDGYFLLLASPQELTTAADIVHKDVIFVFDTSGSMEQEHKIEQARAALERCLHSLNAEDRFGIVAFSDSVNPFRSKLLPATTDNVRLGAEFADSMRASGGTDIHAALNRALEMLNDPERPHVIVFLTDGVATSGITNNPTIAHNIHEKAGSTRLFSFGVGSDVNRTFLEQLGNENRGSFAFVDQGQNIDEVVGGFYAKIARPVLSDLSFDFGDITTAQQYPDVLPDLYKGSQLVMVGRYRTNGDAKAKLIGTLNGQKHEIAFDAKFPAEENDNAFVARLWAQKRIDYLLAQTRLHGEHEEARNEVIALSTRYQIVTPYTSLVAVKAADQGVAMVYPARVRPGDPEVAVRADATSRRVRITLPWGPAKDARWDAMRNLWVARFLVPAGTRDGSYPIHVEVTKADGGLSVLALNISIDTQAPVLVVTADPVHAGGLLQLHAQAAVGPGEILSVLFHRGDRGEALKSLFDVRRVTARLWDGREVDLSIGEGLGFTGSVETSRELAPGAYPVVITAQDFAGNSSRSVAQVQVLP
jgi:Ca-activated chloride channel family protein